MNTEPIGETYVRLALAIDQHLPGYIDAYFGPPFWKDQARSQGLRPLDELSRRAATLAKVVALDVEMDAQRRDFLARHIRAMRTSLGLLAGEKLSLIEEVESLYDISPTWISEKVFERRHRRLDELLPPGGSLQDRLAARSKALEIPIEKAKELLPLIADRLCAATRRRFPLPVDESLEFNFVKDKPWMAYNWYLGAGRSRIEINTDLPLRINHLVKLVAHEAYPGHHTELSIKDRRLLLQSDRQEHCVVLLNSPSSVVSEGIATTALSVILPEGSLRAWYVEEIFPRAGLDPALAESEAVIADILDTLGGASDNAAFMLHVRGASDDDAVAYLRKYELLTEAEARKRVDFIKTPLDRSYVFTYGSGRQLLRSLFEVKQDVTHWYTRLLSEPVTPSQIRGWMAARGWAARLK